MCTEICQQLPRDHQTDILIHHWFRDAQKKNTEWMQSFSVPSLQLIIYFKFEYFHFKNCMQVKGILFSSFIKMGFSFLPETVYTRGHQSSNP